MLDPVLFCHKTGDAYSPEDVEVPYSESLDPFNQRFLGVNLGTQIRELPRTCQN